MCSPFQGERSPKSPILLPFIFSSLSLFLSLSKKLLSSISLHHIYGKLNSGLSNLIMSNDAAAIGTNDTVFSGSAPNSVPSSPRNRVKFLCSHGGKILPRPADGYLKYVGGETRVISVPRDIPFQKLMKKLIYGNDGEMILKYQVAYEDLDALVSVKSDEDLRHMCDEIERYENAGAPRLRAFLFPTSPLVMDNQIMMDHHALEQRYIDAVNGIIRYAAKQHPNINAAQHGSLVSSACSSPRSPDSCTTDVTNNEPVHYNTRLNMHRVQSSPNICTLNVPQQTNQYFHQHPPQYVHHYPAYQSPKPPIGHQKSVTPDRLISVRSVGRTEGMRYQVDPAPPHYYYNSRQSRGNGCCPKCMHYDDLSHFSDRRMTDRTGSLAMSPASSSPRLSHSWMKPWDSPVGGDI